MEKTRLNRISIILDEKNFNQKDLAMHLGCTDNTVSRWCNNINQPDLETIFAIARFFRVEVATLLEPIDWKGETGDAPFVGFLRQKFSQKSKKKKEED